MTNQIIPWLATSYKWSNGGRTVTFTIRQGVKWSDGVPMTARDVYYTYAILTKAMAKKSPSQGDLNGLWNSGSYNAAQSVTQPTANTVAITFKSADYNRLTNWNGFAASSWVLPEHIWANIKDPLSWPDANPVGTGPYLVVKNFTSNSMDLGANPYYWQKLGPDTIRVINYSSNDAASLALEAGQLDWYGSNLIPRVQTTFVARDPQHFHYFYPPIFAFQLEINCLKYPYSLPVFRQALSMAVNRQALDINANYGYAPPADITGLPPSLLKDGWRDPSIPNTLGTYNLPAAKALLLKNGFTYNGSQLIDPKGKPVTMDLIPTFTPTEGPILEQNFSALGIKVNLRMLQSTVFFDLNNKGQFDVLDGWGFGLGPTTFHIYAPYFRKADMYPIGTAIQSGSNWGRWWIPTMEKLFNEFPTVQDVAKQKQLGFQMEKIFVDNLPVIPTVMSPVPEVYSTRNFTGFPSAANNYAAGQPIAYSSDSEYILTRIRPV